MHLNNLRRVPNGEARVGGTKARAFALQDRLIADERLYSGQQITSPNGLVRLIQQSDGNLVLYGEGDAVLWSLDMYGHPGAWTIMQADGNFVVYTAADEPLYSSNSYGNPGAYVVVENLRLLRSLAGLYGGRPGGMGALRLG